MTISGQLCTKSNRGHILGMATNWPRLMPKKAQNVIGRGNEKRRHVIDCQRFVSQPPQNGTAKSGVGGNRTRVQTRKPEAFYMLILWLNFRPISEHKHPNHDLSSRLRLAREAKANCIPEFSTPRDQSPQDGGSCEMFSSYTWYRISKIDILSD